VEEIPPLFLETPYYLAPGKRGEKAYALLRDAMKKSGKADTLRYADELKAPEELGVANVTDLMARLKSVEKKQDKPKRAKGAQRKERPA